MAGIHFKNKLIHQAVVQRTTQSQATDGELIDSWASAGTIDVRFVHKSDRIADEGQGFPMVEDHMALCNAGEDVTEKDRLASITLKADGSSVDAGPFTIESLLRRNTRSAHHISLKLERVE